MIHYHGTPLSPRTELYALAGRHFCVSFSEPRDTRVCMQIGQSCLWDNGAYSAFTRHAAFDAPKLFAWLEPILVHPHRAIILDAIGQDVEAQRVMRRLWPFHRDLSWPVWHIDKSLDYLSELADAYPAVCFGSAGTYWKINSPRWEHRMDEAFNHLAKRTHLPWVHGLRMLSQGNARWPLSSADSINIARNFKTNGRRPNEMADEIDAVQPPGKWVMRPLQEEMAL